MKPSFLKQLSKFFTCAMTGLLLLPPTAKAVDSVYLGLATTSCRTFNKITVLQTPDAKDQLKPYLIWVAGAGTGYENACRSLYNTLCSGKNLDLGRLMVGVREQCNMHPTDLFGDAVVEAWRMIYVTQKSLEAQNAAKEKAKKPHYKAHQSIKRSSAVRKMMKQEQKKTRKPLKKHPLNKAPQSSQAKPLKNTLHKPLPKHPVKAPQ